LPGFDDIFFKLAILSLGLLRIAQDIQIFACILDPRYTTLKNRYKLVAIVFLIGMVNSLDESILNISVALSDRGFMSNTVVIFTSLSGGAVGGMELSVGSNYPLRGSKMTLWEGGLRTVAFVVSDLIVDNCKFL